MTTLPGLPGLSGDQARVGNYRLLALIGEGGMGVVHLAQAPDGDRVALKVLRPHVIGDREARERLAREVNSLKLIRSPRIAEILDADPYGPTPYVTTRYVPGLPLHEHVREEGPIAGEDLTHFAACLADALAAVHAVGVLHRDVKPSNVLMEGRSPVLIDFGLARLAEDARLTQTGWLLGTPGYLAPEILYGDPATPASDVHAWAATVAFAATGDAPYGRGPVMAVMDRVRRGEHDLHGVPLPLRTLIEDCLAPEPLDRPSLPEIRQALATLPGAAPARGGSSTGSRPTPVTQPIVAASREPRTAVVPPVGPTQTPGSAPSATPVSSPAARSAAMPGPASIVPPVPPPADGTRILPDQGPAQPAQPAQWGAPPVLATVPDERRERRWRRVLLGSLGLTTSALVAYLPYVGVAIVALVVLALRAGSVTRERHRRRIQLRGRPRWYDVPKSTLASPGYLVIAMMGVLLLVAWSVGCAIALGFVLRVLGVPIVPAMLLVGTAFTAGLWWGPASLRLRSTVTGLVATSVRGPRHGQVPTAIFAFLALVLVFVLVSAGGPSWTPDVQAPWSQGFFASVADQVTP